MPRRPKAGPTDRPLLVWLVDDTADHHQVADGTVAPFDGVELEHFYTGVEAVETYRLRARGTDGLPDVVLMDFYLSGERGDQITQQLRAVESTRHRPVIVGYSSVASGSQAIVAAGGDLAVRKVASEMTNPFLGDYLRACIAARRGSPV